MSAVWLRVRAELRARWRASVGLVLLAGVPAGVAVAAAIGAARTDSTTDRLVAATRPPLIYMVPDFQDTKIPFEDLARLPVVTEAVVFHGYGSITPAYKDLEISAPRDIEFAPGRTHLVTGRLPRRGRSDESTITYRAADRYHWKVGDEVRFQLARAGSDITGEKPPLPGPTVRTRIVGITASVGDFVGVAAPGMQFGPAFARRYDSTAATSNLYAFSLAGNDVTAFDHELNRLSGGKPILYVDGRSDLAQVRRSFHLQSAALWVLCPFLGLIAGLIFAQSFGRQTLLESADAPSLRALGMTRQDLGILATVRAAIVALGATVVAVCVAAALSPLTPLGTPRLAEPRPGLSLPASTFGLGIGAVVVVVLLLAIIPAIFVTRSVMGPAEVRTRPSSVARLIDRVSRHPARAVGARFALESGKGATAVPVRSSLTASITGIVALVAALIAGASLQHLLTTPSLYGWNWDTVVQGDFSPGSNDFRELMNDPSVSAIAVGTGGQGGQFRIRGKTMEAISVDPVKGDVGPTLLSGRVPVRADEIALGPKSLQAVGAHLGDTVKVGLLPAAATHGLRVVGEVVLPFDDDVSTVGEGIWMSLSAARTFDVRAASTDLAVVRVAPGHDRATTIARLHKRYPGEDGPTATPSRTVRDLGRMSNLPVVLAGLLAALAAGTLAHMLTTSIRRRRRDLAILKTIGFARQQIRSAVGWQAFTFTTVALAIAIPIGIVVGRWTWHLIAHYGGFAPAPAVPGLEIAAVAGASLLAAELLAVLPARAAARTPPALSLRTE